MRMTFDYKENEHKIGRHAADAINEIATLDEPDAAQPGGRRAPTCGPWCRIRSTH